MLLLMMVLTATTAWGQTRYLTLDPNYEGALGVIIPVENDYISGGYHYSLTNFNPANYPQFIREGCSIVGWSTSPTGKIEYAHKSTVTLEGNLTLYARWEVTSGDMKYLITSESPKTVELTKYIGSTQVFLISPVPASITIGGNSYAVTSIGDNAFEDCIGLKSINIPASVTTIGSDAFYGCTGLSSVTFADNCQLTNIENYAFINCNNAGFTSITIPASVQSIGDYAFLGCTYLRSIDVDNDNANYASEDGVLFNKDKTTIIQYPTGKSGTTYAIPASVTNIGKGAFHGCNALTYINIPASVTMIETWAFFNCMSLTSVTVYASAVPTLGTHVFDDNASGRKIYVFSDRENAYKTATNWLSYDSAIYPITLGVNDAGGTLGKWTTYYNGLVDVTVSEGTTIYKAVLSGDKKSVTLTQVSGNIVKRGEAVLLKSTTDIELSSAVNGGEGDYTDNALRGVDYATATSTLGEGTFYVLGKVGNNFGFHRYIGSTMPAQKAYLLLSSNAAPSLSMTFGEETTGISPIENGELRIENSTDAWYTLDGRRLSEKPIAKGVYIVNGRKVFVK